MVVFKIIIIMSIIKRTEYYTAWVMHPFPGLANGQH